MKFLLTVGLAATFCVVSFGQNDEQCKNDLKTFLTCAKTSTSDSDRQTKKKDLQTKGDKCFDVAGCDAPKWDDGPMGRGGPGGPGSMSMPDSVKKCLKRKVIEKMGPKLNECLAKRGVKNVDWASLADTADSAGGGDFMSAGGGEDLQEGMMAIFNAVKAVDKCCQKKGGDTEAVKPLEQCLQDAKKNIKPQVCAALKPCEDKVSAPCKTRGKEVRKALCQCKKEKEQEIAGKLKSLGQQNKKVSIQDLIKTAIDDQDVQSIMNDVDKCYQENNEEEPAMLQMAKAMMGGSGASSNPMMAGMGINGTTCIIMSDMLTLDAKDQSECDDC